MTSAKFGDGWAKFVDVVAKNTQTNLFLTKSKMAENLIRWKLTYGALNSS